MQGEAQLVSYEELLTLSQSEILKKLGSAEQGLSIVEAERRLEAYGAR